MADSRMEKIVSLAKRRGFIYQGSEIYGGLAGTWDYGPYGFILKRKLEDLWLEHFVFGREEMYPLESAILMNPRVWEASGHAATFADPLVECQKCKRRFRADHTKGDSCPECGGALGKPRQFNMMFKTHVGATEDESGVAYLRPETAQGMFVNFKNIVDSFHPRLPFGIAQIGKAFRNEIAPRDFIFRVRELEIMELEYFTNPASWEKAFDYWMNEIRVWFERIGFSKGDIREIEAPPDELAHYSKRTIDFHFNFPHGYDEVGGIAYRTDFDIKNHADSSGIDLRYTDPETGEKFVPHVIEPTFGLGRHLLAVIAKAYTEDELGGERRAFLALPQHLAPVRAAVFPLLKNRPELVVRARTIYADLKRQGIAAQFDDNGNIGKRYRRQDEIGTPACVTIDFQTLDDDTVTVRDRNTGEQVRVEAQSLAGHLA